MSKTILSTLAAFATAALVLGGNAFADTTIRFVSAADQQAALKPIIDAFEKAHPDIKIQYEPIPYDQFLPAMQTRIVGGNPPDVAYVLDRWANAYAGQGVLLPVDDAVSPDYVKVLLPFHWNEFALGGKHYGVPITFNIQAYVVNKTALDKAGIPIPARFEDAWSLTDLINVGRKLKAAKVVDYPFAFWTASTPSRLSQFLVANGGSVLDAKHDAANLDNSVTRNLLAQMKSAFDEGLVPPDNWTAPNDIFPLFLSGKLAIQTAGGNFTKPAIDQAKVNFDWTFAPMQTTLGTANPVIVFKNTKSPKEAFEFVDFLESKESELTFARMASYLPARQDISTDELSSAFGKDAAKIQILMKEQTKGISPVIIGEMSSPAWSDIDIFMRGELEALSINQTTPDALISDSTKEIGRIISKYPTQ